MNWFYDICSSIFHQPVTHQFQHQFSISISGQIVVTSYIYIHVYILIQCSPHIQALYIYALYTSYIGENEYIIRFYYMCIIILLETLIFTYTMISVTYFDIYLTFCSSNFCPHDKLHISHRFIITYISYHILTGAKGIE